MTTVSEYPLSAHGVLENRWTDIFRHDALVHLGIMASVTAGTFQGYLKDRIAGPLPYALAELFFIAAVIVWFAGLALRHEPLRGPGRVPTLVLMVIALPALYLLHPGSTLVVELAGLRGWAEFPVACLMALTVVRSSAQMRAHIGLILVLCTITAVYGLHQYWVGPEEALGVSALAQLRHGATVFYQLGQSGERAFRAFSTFTFPAPFAAMMVYGMLFAAAIALSQHRGRWARRIAVVLIPLYFLGMTASGTRAALISLLLGAVVIGWHARMRRRTLLLVPVALAAVYGALVITAGAVLQRFESLWSHEGLLWTYVLAPVTIAARSLSEHPFGMGLGRSGVGVPFGIVQSYPEGFFRGSDGDIGRAAVEMGVFGIVLLLLIVAGLLPYALRAVRALRASAADDVALGIGAIVLSTAIVILIGSPLSASPHATIWWFMVGGLFKLWMMGGEPPGESRSEA